MNDTAWFQPHHDGSGMYVPDPNPKLGGKIGRITLPADGPAFEMWRNSGGNRGGTGMALVMRSSLQD